MASGAKIILSKLPVGDLATQFFADRNLFCAGRVAQDDMERVAKVRSGVCLCRRPAVPRLLVVGGCAKRVGENVPSVFGWLIA